jgi:hypothetical protein
LDSALQKQRHELQRQWAELQRREIGDLKAYVSQSTKVVLSLRTAHTSHLTVIQEDGRKQLLGLSENPQESQALERKVTKVKKAQKQQQLFMARLTGLRWLSLTSRALEVSGYKAPSGWNFTIRTFNIIPCNADVMIYARRGLLEQVQELFSTGKASPFDRDEDGRPIFTVCATIFSTTLS